MPTSATSSLTPELKAALGVLVILGGTLLLWMVLARAANQSRRRYEELLAREDQTSGPPGDLAAVQRRLTALHLVVNTGKYILAATALLLMLRQVGIQLDSLLLPAGFLGAALGLGAQNLVRDIVAGVFIIFEGQFAVGDIVSINGTLGTVEEVGLRVTRLRDDAAQLHFFPNGAITTVSKYPTRYVSLLLVVPLADGEQRGTAVDVVLAAVRAFDARFNALDGPVELLTLAAGSEGEESQATLAPVANPVAEPPAKPEPGKTAEPDGKEVRSATLCFRLSAWPPRVATARDKLPIHVKLALNEAHIATQTDASIEVMNAPA